MRTITSAQVLAAKAVTDELAKTVDRLFISANSGAAVDRLLDSTNALLDTAARNLGEVNALLGAPAGSFTADTKLNQLAHAIAFQRQVELGYGGEVRTIEPSVIKPTRGGKYLVYALRVEPGKAPSMRSYRLDRIESVSVTDVPFTAAE